jgi:homeobox protein engrailed
VNFNRNFIMADESPVIRHHSLRHYKSSNPISDHQSDNLVSDEELSVGGTTPPPPDQQSGDEFPSPESLKDEHRDINGISEDDKDSVASATNIIKFSIDNILNPEFGNRMNPVESAAAVAFHTHHHQLIQQQQMSSSASATTGNFLGAFHQLPFLAAARQMILAATAAAGSSIDYHQHQLAAHHASVAQAITHPHPLNTMLLAHQAHHHHPTTLNLVENCTDKYLGGNNSKNWPHQPTPTGGALTGRSTSHPLSALTSATVASSAKIKTQPVNKVHHQPTGSKAIDLSVRNSASPPDPVHRLTSGIGTEKQSASQESPSIHSSSTDNDNSSASPVRSVSVSPLSFLFLILTIVFSYISLSVCVTQTIYIHSILISKHATIKYFHIQTCCV